MLYKIRLESGQEFYVLASGAGNAMDQASDLGFTHEQIRGAYGPMDPAELVRLAETAPQDHTACGAACPAFYYAGVPLEQIPELAGTRAKVAAHRESLRRSAARERATRFGGGATA